MNGFDIESFKKIYTEEAVDDPTNEVKDHVPLPTLAYDRVSNNLQFSNEDLAKIEANFHSLIYYRCRNAKDCLKWLDTQELPKITNELLQEKEPQYFSVAGMYGGFSYSLFDLDGPTLITDSWSRIVGGSGERHHITANEVSLVERGFV